MTLLAMFEECAFQVVDGFPHVILWEPCGSAACFLKLALDLLSDDLVSSPIVAGQGQERGQDRQPHGLGVKLVIAIPGKVRNVVELVVPVVRCCSRS
jgi:hypothetical protein